MINKDGSIRSHSFGIDPKTGAIKTRSRQTVALRNRTVKVTTSTAPWDKPRRTEMTTINHEVNEMIQTEEDIYNVIVDLKALVEHYVSPRADNGSTRTQALVTIKEANRLLQKLKE